MDDTKRDRRMQAQCMSIMSDTEHLTLETYMSACVHDVFCRP